MALFRHLLTGTFPGESWSFGLHTTGSISVSAAQTAWGNAIAGFALPAYLATLDDTVAFNAISTAELNQPTGAQLTRVEDPRSETGTATTGSLPFQCAPVVSLRTALATRAGRGRFYAPSPAAAVQDGGRLTPAAQAALADASAAMFAALASAALTPVLYSRTTKATQPITSLDVGDVIDTQRRRRNKLIEARTSRIL